MALLAIGAAAFGRVLAGVVLRVAAVAVPGRPRVPPTRVAGTAGQACVGAREGEARPAVVEVRGPPSVLSKLTEKDVRATVELASTEPLQSSRRRVDISTPPGVTLVRVFPTDVDMLAPPKP